MNYNREKNCGIITSGVLVRMWEGLVAIYLHIHGGTYEKHEDPHSE